MAALLPTLRLDSTPVLRRLFALHQLHWIEDEDHIHAQGKQVCALAEKSIRIGWTYCDGFKNVRKRLRFKKRDYLFVTKDFPSALEYMNLAWDFAELFDLTKSILSRGEEHLKIPRLDGRGRSSGFTEEIKVGVIKFDTGSRIIAFSSNPQAMAVYGGDVGLDEFAKHPNARLLWETAQGRVALAHDIAVWSSHDGEDTLFYQFVQQARLSSIAPANEDASLPSSSSSASASASASFCPAPLPAKINTHHAPRNTESATPPSNIERPESSIPPHPSTISPFQSSNSQLQSPWNLFYRVTMPDAIELGFLDIINQSRGTKLRPEQFLADCQARAGLPEIYEQAYLCNPVPPAASIVDWSAIERCRHDYEIDRLHLDHDQIQTQFGSPSPHLQSDREQKISAHLHSHFPTLFLGNSPLHRRGGEGQGEGAFSQPSTPNPQLRLGFDIAASGHGDLACIYLDAVQNSQLWLAALFTCRTDDWHFLKTALFTFLRLPNVRGAGDESGLGRQICWEAANHFGRNKFIKVNFASKKSDLGFLLMNQLSTADKRLPKSHPDIAADFFALRKNFTGSKWLFSEGKNPYNPASHCDIAWAGALASEAHAQKRSTAWAMVG